MRPRQASPEAAAWGGRLLSEAASHLAPAEDGSLTGAARCDPQADVTKRCDPEADVTKRQPVWKMARGVAL